MKTSAGILVIFDKMALLAHPTKSPWYGTYMPPKGGLETGETVKEAASREMKEETGIEIPSKLLEKSFVIDYKDPRGKTYKRVVIFIHKIENLSEIKLTGLVIPKEQLQLEEVDDCRFMNKEEIESRVFSRFKEAVLESIK